MLRKRHLQLLKQIHSLRIRLIQMDRLRHRSMLWLKKLKLQHLQLISRKVSLLEMQMPALSRKVISLVLLN